jgi:hypothetical protein
MNRKPHFRHTLTFGSLLALAALVTPPGAPAITPQSEQSADAGTLVALEEAFARTARDRGTRAAFLEYLSEDGIVLRPGPVKGRDYWQAARDEGEVLQSYPSRAAIAVSGDLGYTLGPWTSGRRGRRPQAFGHYLTVWKRDGDAWRAAIHGGISHPQRSDSPRLTAGAVMHEPNGLKKLRLDTDGLEKRFATSARASGYEATAAVWAIERSVRMRDGAEPSGFAPVAAAAPVELVVEGSDLSAAADLAYTYGTVTEEDGRRAAFLHVWRVIDGEPYLAVDLLTRLPDAATRSSAAP